MLLCRYSVACSPMWASMYFTASPTVAIFSASSSGISTPNSSSSAITSSTTSSESAPRSSTNEDPGEISSAATPSCSTTMFLTRSKMDAIELPTPPWYSGTSRYTLFVPVSCSGEHRWQNAHGRLRDSVGAFCAPHFCVLTLSHDQSAVHIQDLSGDVRCVVRGEEDHRGGYFLRFPCPPQGDLLQKDFHLIG